MTGIEFRESLLLINDKCKQLVQKNMTFIVAVGLQNFPNTEASDVGAKTCSIFLSDTVLICDVSFVVLMFTTQEYKILEWPQRDSDGASKEPPSVEYD